MSSLHRIRVLGRELQVRSAAHPETVQEIENFVNGKIAEAAASIKGGDSQVVTILTLMTMAEAYLSLQKEHERSRLHDVERANALIEKLDSVVLPG